MKTTLERVTPAIAREWLKYNAANPRKLRRAYVDELKGAYSRNEYVQTHQGVAFNTRGELIDGQHRLTAIAEMPPGFSLEMIVTRDVDPRAGDVIDIGMKRSPADALGEDRRLVEVARFFATLYHGLTRVTPTMLRPFVELVREPHADLMAFCSRTQRYFGSAPFRAAVVAVHLSGGDVDYAKLVYRALATVDFDTMTPSARALYRAYDKGHFSARNQVETFIRGVRVFDPKFEQVSKHFLTESGPVVEKMRRMLERLLNMERAPVHTRTRSVRPSKPPHQYQHGAR